MDKLSILKNCLTVMNILYRKASSRFRECFIFFFCGSVIIPRKRMLPLQKYFFYFFKAKMLGTDIIIVVKLRFKTLLFNLNRNAKLYQGKEKSNILYIIYLYFV